MSQPAPEPTEGPSERPGEPALVRRLRERRETHSEHGRIYRAAFVVAGIVVLLCGVIMLVTPGPAFVLIPIGLAILSLEFAWAATLLEGVLDRADAAKQSATEASTAQKVVVACATVAGIAAVVTWAIMGDIPLVPV